MQDPPTSEEDNAAIIKAINEANRDLLWIGMTAPKHSVDIMIAWKKARMSLRGSMC